MFGMAIMITTNWLFADLFQKHFPYVVLEDDKVIVDHHEEAITASKILMINVHDQPQSTFSIFQFQHDHSDEAIAKVQGFIEKNYGQGMTLDDLAGRSN